MLLLGALLLAAPRADAVIQYCDQVAFPTCVVDLVDCEFDFDYGSTGGAFSLGAVHVFGLGTFTNPDLQAGTGLEIDCSIFGVGRDFVRIRTRIINATGSTAESIRLFAFVNPNGNTFTSTTFLYDAPSVSFTSAEPGEPDHWGIDDVANLDTQTPGNIDFEIFGAGLSDTNYCGAFCDVVFALQWSVGDLPTDEQVVLNVGLSDVGHTLSENYLQAARTDDLGVPDDPTTVLTLSGTARVGTSAIPALPIWGIAALALGLATAAGLRPR
jgi:hypothetical protein